MDIATRYQPRARGESFLDREKEEAIAAQTRGDEPYARRKSTRPGIPPAEDSVVFRKPSLPASATRQPASTHQRQLSSSHATNGDVASTHKRRTSAVMRETRVPSGPRDYPGSPAKRYTSEEARYDKTDGYRTVPAAKATINVSSAARQPTYSAQTPELPFNRDTNFGYSPPSELTRGYFGNPAGEDISEPTTPASRSRAESGSMDFLPSVNFDEFQTSLSTLDTNSTFNSNMYDDYPSIGAPRVLRSDALQPTKAVSKRSMEQERSSSNSRRVSVSRGSSTREQNPNRASRIPSDSKSFLSTTGSSSGQGPIARATAALKARRQSTAAAIAATEADKAAKSSKLRSALDSNSTTHAHSASIGLVQSSSNLAMTQSQESLPTSKSRRITLSNFSLDQNRNAAPLNPPSNSRKTKGRSLLPPPADSNPNTPTAKTNGKGSARTHTPSSSGNNRRLSIASGRMSGLGARTISPTDSRRQRRLSMALQQPPMPGQTSPGESLPMQQHLQKLNKLSDLPRLVSVPNSLSVSRGNPSPGVEHDMTRVSPGEVNVNKFGYPFPSTSSTPGQLSTKSSYASLHTVSSAAGVTSNVQSRVPILRFRTATSTATSGSSGEDSQASTEMIPPVPAIPKGYDSPKDPEPLPFGQLGPTSKNRKSSMPYQAQDDAYYGTAVDARTSPDSGSSVNKRKSMITSDSRPSLVTSISTGPLETSASHSTYSRIATNGETGRQNNSLQPLRLPPLNIGPLSMSSKSTDTGPRPSHELDERSRLHITNGMQTPDWSRYGHKTPSTPMTASKATFGHRADKQGAMRSSTSHHTAHDPTALRTGWLDDSGDEAFSQGLSLTAAPSRQSFGRATAASRTAITPFASGSLPKGSGEFARHLDVQSANHVENAPHLAQTPRPHETTKVKSKSSRPSMGSLGDSVQSPDEAAVVDDKDTPISKKEGSGLRRRLSLGWRRSSSKNASHADNQKDGDTPKSARDVAHTSSMLPPKLPSSIDFNGDGSLGMSLSARPSLDGDGASLSERLRRRTLTKQAADPNYGDVESSRIDALEAATAATKTRSLHSDRAQPASNLRSASYGTLNRSSLTDKLHLTHPKTSRPNSTAFSVNVLIKDKDDLAADEEMRRLTQKKKDVDQVARTTDELMRRAFAKQPMSIDDVLHDRQSSLNIFERGEVIEYENEGIYFTGTKQAKKIVGCLHPAAQPSEAKGSDKSKSGNYGYDDERGDYNIVLGDHLAYRYEVCDVLGKGSFGQVVRCIDHKEGGVVAVKIIRNKKRFHQQALVEVGILGKLREWDPDGAHATLSITGSFYFRSHLCIVTPCLSINLYELIRAHNFSGFSLPLIRRFARQLLACLVLLQEKRVIHCDLKPENILLCTARAADVRVIDFGSSCREEEKVYTYIQSRFYRSPEVILGSSYGLGIDMWSFGCILAELWTGYPIFPGENEQEQLACIMEIFGPPDRHLVDRCTRKKLFFDSVGKPRVTVSSKGRRRRPSSKTLQQALKTEDEAFVDFIAKCLRWDPDRRLKPQDACAHPFIANQPMGTRSGIPDEARRAARVRSTAAIPTAISPVKRPHPQAASSVSSVNTTASTSQHKTGGASARQMPDTPQTALRAPAIITASTALQSSPVKASNRRQSNIASAGGAAALRRQSNGAALAVSMGLPHSKTTSSLTGLAEKAARESMAATTNGLAASASGSLTSNGSGRWRV